MPTAMALVESARRYFALHGLPARRLAILLLLMVLLVGSDVLDVVPYVDADTLSFEVEVLLALTALAMSLADRLSADERRAWRNRAILVCVTLALASAAAEGATRWLFRDVTTAADNGAYFSRRWMRAGHVVRNGDGFRERPFAAKPAGVYRIAIVGDSFTFGNGLETRQRFSDLLQQWLPARVEILNMGIPGDNTPQHLETVRSRVLPLDPDYVLLQWFVNDIEGDEVRFRPALRPLLPAEPVHNWLLIRSALYTVANVRWGDLQVRRGISGSYADYLRERAGHPDSPDARRDAQQWRAILDVCRQRGIGAGLVLFPDTSGPLDDSYAFGYLHDRMRKLCDEEGLTCLDLRSDFAAVPDRRALWVSPFDHHPSARANAIAAVRILETFRREWNP